ncbi:hypothetical protein PR048_009245 [Dryococelus australis]|uniref:RNase H type-1 domain-containing protein n=1 Tax=Dryococelus australis TaxID=614101 RepID=A0ABQ9HZG4_9NEOP|nr:hypothetical protein PR048_009245 [Dryococelus australis]
MQQPDPKPNPGTPAHPCPLYRRGSEILALGNQACSLAGVLPIPLVPLQGTTVAGCRSPPSLSTRTFSSLWSSRSTSATSSTSSSRSTRAPGPGASTSRQLTVPQLGQQLPQVTNHPGKPALIHPTICKAGITIPDFVPSRKATRPVLYTGQAPALRYDQECNIPHVLIITDSNSVLVLLASYHWLQNPVIWAIRDLFLQLVQLMVQIQFAWVPSHVGIVGNEYVDRLAKLAVESGVPVQIVSYFPLFALISRLITDDWNLLWCLYLETKGGLYSSLHLKGTFRNPGGCTVSRREAVISLRLRSGHNASPAHLHRLNIVPCPACVCGSPVGDIAHYVLQSPKGGSWEELYSALRLNIVELPESVDLQSPTAHKDWEIFEWDFENYLIATGQDECPDKVKIVLLKICLVHKDVLCLIPFTFPQRTG